MPIEQVNLLIETFTLLALCAGAVGALCYQIFMGLLENLGEWLLRRQRIAAARHRSAVAREAAIGGQAGACDSVATGGELSGDSLPLESAIR